MSQEKQQNEGTVSQEAQVIRRKDLTDLADTFKQALCPVQNLVGLVGDQNVLVKETNRQVKDTSHKQKWQSVWLIALTIGFIAVAVAQTRTSSAQDVTAKSQKQLVESGAQVQKDLSDVTVELRGLVALAKKTGQQVEDIKENKETEPEVQLVAETDPVKARRAPVKVRILPPKKKGAAPPPQSAVELPIPSKHVK